MGMTTHYDDELYPVGGDGVDDKSTMPTHFGIVVCNSHGKDQIYLRIYNWVDGETMFPLTKGQAKMLSIGARSAESKIAYRNN